MRASKSLLCCLASAWVACLALSLWGIGQAARADGYTFRPYVQVKGGKSFYLDDSSVFDVELANPSRHLSFGGTVGADVGNHLGVEFAIDHVKTVLESPSIGKIGDYAVTTFTGLGRLRYPLMGGRFVPYALAGGGVALGEFSGRETFDIDTGGSGYSPVAVVGVGAEYFFTDNMALGVEARNNLLIEAPLRLGSDEEDMNLSNIALSASLRIYLDRAAGLRDERDDLRPPPADSDALRGYMILRGGQAYFLERKSVPGIEVDRSTGILGVAGVGLNFDEHLGAEIVAEYGRAQIRDRAGNKITGYPVYTIIAQGRYREPILEGRLSPYALAGVGLGCGELGDRDVPVQGSGFDAEPDCTLVGTFGGGFDYFLEDNLAFTFESKYVAPLSTDVRMGGRPHELDLNHVSWSAGLRIFFP